MTVLIQSKEISKHFKHVKAVTEVDIKIEEGKFYGILGRSGSGKTTLLSILGLLDKPTSGVLYFKDEDTDKLKNSQKAKIRMKNIGFVFQDFHLNLTMKAFENVMIPMIINLEIKKNEMKNRAFKLLRAFDLGERMNHLPSELSGGEKQRVALARALATNDDRIVDFYHQNYGMASYLSDESIPNLASKYKMDESTGVVILHSYKKAYENIIVDGRGINDGENNVGLIPKDYLPIDSFEIDFSKNPFETIDTYEYTFEVIGTYDALTELFEPNEIIIPYEDLQEMHVIRTNNDRGLTKDYNKTYHIEVDSIDNVKAIIDLLIKNGFDPYTVSSVGPIAQTSRMILAFGTIISAIILVLTGLLIGFTVYKSIHDRRQELGMMRVVGYSNVQLIKIIIVETFIIGMTSVIITCIILAIGVNIGKLIISMRASLYGQRFKIIVPLNKLIINVCLAIIIPVLAGIYSSKEILEVEPLDAIYMRKEE